MQHAYAMPAGTFSSTSLKRARSGDFPKPSTEVPRLPDISTDLVLEVYTHESLRPPNATSPEDFTDNRRLAKLGESVLNTAVTMVLFKKQPLLSFDEINEHREVIMSNDVIQGWVKIYQMASRILCRAEYQPKRDTPEECRRVFCAYVGAVYRNSGQEVVGKWIDLLVNQYEQKGAATMTMSGETPPAKKVKNEPADLCLTSLTALSPTASSTASTGSTSTDTSPSAQVYSPTAPYMNASQQYPSTYPARQAPPHMSKSPYTPAQMASVLTANTTTPQQLNALFQSLTKLSQSPALRAVTGNHSQRAQSMTTDGKTSFGQGMALSSGSQSRLNPLAPAMPNAPFLPMFNQSANQRGVKVDYSAEFEGPAHAGQWLVECLVNDIPKGKGKGSSKQIAKEEAARQAYYSMGWT